MGLFCRDWAPGKWTPCEMKVPRVQAPAQQSLRSAELSLGEVHVAHTLRLPGQRPLPVPRVTPPSLVTGGQ